MSDTPRTDAIKIRCGFQAVPEPMLQHAYELERENAALREDKERLDWLESGCSCDLSWVGKEAPPDALTSLRNAIDWTRKEAQP